jgi:hypothetical protein
MGEKFSASSFFKGLAFGLVSLSLLGFLVVPSHLVRNFVRFHQGMSAEFDFFPTPRELISIMRRDGETDSIYVVVGGSSVLHGIGQQVGIIWSQKLQELLGGNYRVVNFAMRGGKPGELGDIAAEFLLKNSEKVIFVADGNIQNFSVDYSQGFYAQSVYQAWLRGYLFPWKPRDDFLRREWIRSPKMRAPALGSILDLALNFSDLWNYVCFEDFGLIWNGLLNTNSFTPRRKVEDSEMPPEYLDAHRYTLPFEREMNIVQGAILPPEASLSGSIQETDNTIPPQLRAVTLVAIDLDSPYYRSRLSPQEQTQILNQADEHARLLEKIGFMRAIVYGSDFNEEDYIDRVHLSHRGGYKLAAIVARQVKELSNRLGYIR